MMGQSGDVLMLCWEGRVVFLVVVVMGQGSLVFVVLRILVLVFFLHRIGTELVRLGRFWLGIFFGYGLCLARGVVPFGLV